MYTSNLTKESQGAVGTDKHSNDFSNDSEGTMWGLLGSCVCARWGEIVFVGLWGCIGYNLLGSAGFTRRGSLVRIQYRPPYKPFQPSDLQKKVAGLFFLA